MRMTRRHLLGLSGATLLGLTVRQPRALAAGKTQQPRALRILILGGTGFTGPHQVRYALSRGHQITLFNRGRQPHEWPGAVEELIGDRNTGDLKALKGREWDVCIDNPTTLPFWVRDAGRVLHGKIKHYVFISTISVYADNLKPADESAPVASYTGKDAMSETMESLRANGELYGPLKALSEKEAQLQFSGKATIIRPGLIVGPGDETDRFTYWPVRLARGGEVLAPGDGSDPVQIIDARDLAEWTIRMAEAHTLGTFNATGPEQPLPMRAMLTGIAAAIHADRGVLGAAGDADAEGVQVLATCGLITGLDPILKCGEVKRILGNVWNRVDHLCADRCRNRAALCLQLCARGLNLDPLRRRTDAQSALDLHRL